MHEGSSHAAKLTMDNTHREEEIKRLKRDTDISAATPFVLVPFPGEEEAVWERDHTVVN